MSNKKRTERKFRKAIMPTSAHPAIRQVKRQGNPPTIHGNKLWKSSCLLIDYMSKNPPEHTDSVIDVGCGWGIGGIWAAKTFGSRVTSMDADPNVFPYLEAVAELNGVTTDHMVARFEKLSKAKLKKFDMLIAADICFWDELVEPVFKMVDRALNAGVKHILISDPERPTFLEMAQRCQEEFGGELFDWQARGSIDARGAILLIENA